MMKSLCNILYLCVLLVFFQVYVLFLSLLILCYFFRFSFLVLYLLLHGPIMFRTFFSLPSCNSIAY